MNDQSTGNHSEAVTAADPTPHAARELDRSTAARLAWLRYLFWMAEQQAELPESMRSVAILALHDTVELYLHLAAQHVNVPLSRSKRLEFGEYFSEIEKAASSVRLTRQQQMKQLNTARVGLKHDGIRPAPEDVETLLIQVGRFLAENTPRVFGIPLESVSIVDLIRFPRARQHLRDAETALAQGDTGTATIELVQGFHSAVEEYEQEAITAHGRSPFSFADDFTFDRSFYRHGALGGSPFVPSDQGEFEDRIIKSIESLGAAVKLLSLGLDYRRYARYRLLTPPLHLLPVPGKAGPRLHLDEKDNWPPSEDDSRFCLDFAVDAALHLQGVVFSEPSWRLGKNAQRASDMGS